MQGNSIPDTQKHIKEVQDSLNKFMSILSLRGRYHDLSKLKDPELEYFDNYGSAAFKDIETYC